MKHKSIPFHITKRNQKQPIPQTRISQAKIQNMVRRIKDLTLRLDELRAEESKIDQSLQNLQGLPVVVQNSLYQNQIQYINFKAAWLRHFFPASMQNTTSIETVKIALAEAQKELEYLAKDPVYRKYILLSKLRME